jgi:anti-sigma factor RsiW
MQHPEDLLSGYVDGTLSNREATEVAAHLAECPACRETLADLEAVRRLLAAAPPPHPPSDMLPRLLTIPERAANSRYSPRAWVVATVGLLAAALLSARIPQLPPASDAVVEELRDHAGLGRYTPLGEPGLASFVSLVLSAESERR